MFPFGLSINVNKTKRRLYDLALRSDARPATYKVRQVSNVVGTPDSFQNYLLTRVTYRPATQDELVLAQATLNDLFVVWSITAYDLSISPLDTDPNTPIGAPVPQVTYELVIDENTWTIERATNLDLFQAWDCICRLAR